MAVEGGDSRPGGPKKEVKSYAVRMAGIAAANASVFEIPEKEGRLRWQAKWHELEQQARSGTFDSPPWEPTAPARRTTWWRRGARWRCSPRAAAR